MYPIIFLDRKIVQVKLKSDFETIYLCAMKKTFRIFSLLNLFALYCFISGFYYANALTSFDNSALIGQVKSSENFLSSSSDNLLGHSILSESYFGGFGNILNYSPRKQVNSLAFQQKAAEINLFNTLIDYLSGSKNIVLKLKKTDIIFPYHFFW